MVLTRVPVPSVPRVWVGILMGSTPRVVTGGPSIPGEFRPQCQTLPRGLAPEVQRQSAPPPCEPRFGWDQQKRFWKGSHPVDLKMELLESVWLVSPPGKAAPPGRPSRVSGLEAWLSSASPWICWPSACPCYGAPPVLASLTGLRPQEDGWGSRGPTPPLPALVHFGPVAAGAEQCLPPHFPAGYRLQAGLQQGWLCPRVCWTCSEATVVEGGIPWPYWCRSQL